MNKRSTHLGGASATRTLGSKRSTQQAQQAVFAAGVVVCVLFARAPNGEREREREKGGGGEGGFIYNQQVTEGQ
jgi:hypothetical protein